MIKEAIEYFEAGLSVIPCEVNKKPIGSWKINQSQLLYPSKIDESTPCIGVVCGDISGGLEVIDLDLKYDITGSLFNDYKEMINDNAPALLRKLVVQKTQNNGYHFIYRCGNIEGNVKLARRYTTEDELKNNKNEKIKVLIETRGNGGYIVAAPSAGYEIIYGDMNKINTITKEERDILFTCAKTFNSVYDSTPDKNLVKVKSFQSGLSPFDDYNNRGEIHALLEEFGWTFIKDLKGNSMYLRPAGTGTWSAGWSEEKRLLYIFTTSSEFDSEKAYSPVAVLATLKFNKDYSACSKWLYASGFGDRNDKKPSEQPEVDILDCVATNEEGDVYINQIRLGTFQMGKVTGIPELDKHWLFKPAYFNIINGHDNVGKSTVIWYLAVLSAIKHDWKWIIYSSENSIGGVKRKLMEFFLCKSIKEMTDMELMDTKRWVEEHFTLIKQTKLFSYKEIIEIGEKINLKKQHQAFLIDPYNNMFMPNEKNRHEWDYAATMELRLFAKKTGCSVYLNCHAVTEALRRKYPNGHELAGYPMPPEKADTEGGGKFSNKADDFLTIHRIPSHPTEWMWTDIHVKKIKEVESGGRHTFQENPVRIRMIHGGVGFEDVNGYNPVTMKKTGHASVSPRDSSSVPDKFTEPKKSWEDEDAPF